MFGLEKSLYKCLYIIYAYNIVIKDNIEYSMDTLLDT